MDTLQSISDANKKAAVEAMEQIKAQYERLNIKVTVEVIPMTFVAKVTDAATGEELIEHYLKLANA